MPDSCDIETLAAIPLFRDLPDEQLKTLVRGVWRKTLAAGHELLQNGRNGSIVYILLEGTVKVFVRRIDGTPVVLAICGAGEVLGEISVLDGQGHSASVVTLEESHFLLVERAFLLQSLQTMPLLSLNLARNAMRRLRLATGQIQALARQDVNGRVACQLLAFADRYGCSVPLPTALNATRKKPRNRAKDLSAEPEADFESNVEIALPNAAELASEAAPVGKESVTPDAVLIPLRLTQGDLADLIGASRVRVNQVLISYRKSGFIAIDGNHRITLLNRAALQNRCG